MKQFSFPPWTNKLRALLGVASVGGLVYLVVFVYYGFSPKTVNVGYQPVQPVPYSHAIHVGKLGMDCRYCHSTVEQSAMAAVPPTATCMNCHERILTQSPKLLPVRESFASGKSIPWVRVHDLPDYVYFNHSAHVQRGVGCVSCHGRIDKMTEVYQAKPLNMGWCLECHRAPEKNLRPKELVTAMDWQPEGDPVALGSKLREENHINPPTDCSTCHR